VDNGHPARPVLNNSRLTRFTVHALGVLEEKIMTYSWHPRVVSKNIPHESVTVERKELIPRFTVRKFESGAYSCK
jgi:hypothetical protein